MKRFAFLYINRAIFPFALIALFVCAGWSRAQATVTASLAAKPPSYAGSCPVDMSFTGSVSSSAAGTFQYRFVRSNGSTNPTTGKLSYTFPVAGALNVADIWYQLSLSGNDKLEVYNTSGTLLLTATASFTIACAQPGSLSASVGKFSESKLTPHFKMAPLEIGLVPPTSLHDTKDPQLCTQHVPSTGWTQVLIGTMCADWMNEGKLVLVWDWAADCPSGRTCSVDGYRLYPSRTGVSAPAAITTTTNGSASTMTVIDPRSSSSGCYAVTAFKGDVESDTSIDFCVVGFTPGLPKGSVTLSPDLLRSAVHSHEWRGALNSGHAVLAVDINPVSKAETSEVTVGFYHQSERGFLDPGGFVDNEAWQGAVRFDLGNLAGKSVTSASLSFDLIDYPRFEANKNCLAAISLAKVDWSNINDWIPREDYITGIAWGPVSDVSFSTSDWSEDHRNFVVNVTPAVQYWVQNVKPNFGFVLVSGNEDTGSSDALLYCLNRARNFKLTVNYVGGK